MWYLLAEVCYHKQNNRTKPISTNQLASISTRGIEIVLDFEVEWNFTPPDKDPIVVDYDYDYAESRPFLNVKYAFDSSVNCRHVLPDKFWIPKDNCEVIVEGIKLGTAQAISNRSFDPMNELGTSSMMIVGNKTNENKLTLYLEQKEIKTCTEVK